MSNCFAESIGKISSDLNTQNHRCGGAHDEHHHFSKRKCSENFCILTIWKQLPRNGFERSGRGQEPSRGHKFSILENFLSIRDFTSQTLASFPSDLVGVALVGATPLHLLSQTALPLKSPTGAFIAALRCANASLPMAGGAGSSHPQQRETERSRLLGIRKTVFEK